ncbi:hypothetical protein HKD37_15G043988 [Glycine soja]
MKNPCDERWCVVLQGKTIGVNVEDDDSYMDTYVSPLSTQMTPNVVREEEADDIHANRNNHDEGELINIDHGFSTCLASSSFRCISFAVCREADTQSLTYMILVDVTYENWKEIPTAQKDLIWEDIQAEFEILEASDCRTKKKLLQTVSESWRQFKSDLTRKWALAADQDGVDDTVCEKYGISKEKWAQLFQTRRDPSWETIQKQNTGPHVLSRGGYEYLEQKLLAEKMKKKLEEAAESGSVDCIIDPPSPIRRHVKWKMARTKKIGEMTTEAAKEIAEKIDSFEEQATQGSFVPHGQHPGRVRAAGAGVTIKQYFGSAPWTIAVADPANQGPARGVDHRKSGSATHGIVQPDAVPDAILGTCTTSRASGPRVSTKGSCVDPSVNDLETGDSDRCSLYIEANPARLVALGRVYEGSTIVHNTPLLPSQVKVGVEEVKDPDALVLVPTDEVSLVGQAIHTFLAWPTHLVKSLSQQAAVSPTKPLQKLDPKVDDPLYLMTLTIPELFLRPYQVTWDATMFGVFNPDFPLYIKHEDLSKITHGGQCLSISVLQLWILAHWQMVVILPKENIVVWFCSLHNRPDNYLKGIINIALKGLDDIPQPKSKAGTRWIVVKCNRQKGSTKCGYYYFNDVRPLEVERLKAFRIQWAQ